MYHNYPRKIEVIHCGYTRVLDEYPCVEEVVVCSLDEKSLRHEKSNLFKRKTLDGGIDANAFNSFFPFPLACF